MKKATAAALLLAGLSLILDSRCAADSAREALQLCARALVPSLFPLFVVSAVLVPGLRGVRLPRLCRLLGIPEGAAGLWLLGSVGGFPVGAAAVSQAVRSGQLTKTDGCRMLGLCSLCGPAFLLGVLPQMLPMEQLLAVLVIQLETAVLLAVFWPGHSRGALSPAPGELSLPRAVRQATDSILSVCAWVVLAGVATGFLRRWAFPLLPGWCGTILTGLLELTTGIAALGQEGRFLPCILFVCFGGCSVLLQIGGLAAEAGLSMGTCILQKTLHGILGLAAGFLYLHLGPAAFLLPALPIFLKIMVEIPDRLVYNVRERKGSECCFAKKWSAPANTAATARK